MSKQNVTPSTNWERDTSWYGGAKRATFRQRVNLTHGAAYVPLDTAGLPDRCRVIAFRLLAVTALAVTGNDGTSTANTLALLMFPTTNTQPVTAPPSTATQSNPSGTNGYMIGRLPSTASNVRAAGAPMFETSVIGQNTNTVPAFLAVAPAFTNSNRVYMNGVTGFVFGTSTNTSANTAGQVDVLLHVEIYDDEPGFQN